MKAIHIRPANMALLFLIAAQNVFRNFLWIIPAALMAPIMEELSLNYTQSGQMSLIVTVLMGVFLIVGSYILGRIGPVRAMVIGLLCTAMDGVFSCFGSSFAAIMAGKVLLGMGYGFGTCATTALIAACFPKEQLGFINGLNACISSLTIAMAYQFIAPIYGALGSWRTESVFFGAGSLIVAILFLFWCEVSDVSDLTKVGRRENNIHEALSFLVIRRFAFIFSCLMLVYVSVTSYYPNFLHQAKGFPLDTAGSMVSVMSVAGMVGSLCTGVAVHRLRKPKLFLLAAFLLLTFGFAGMVLLNNYVLLLCAISCFGACFTATSTFCTTIIMRLPGVSPLTTSAGSSLMSACGSLLAIAVPPVQQLLIARVGLQGSMSVFSVLLAPALVGLLLLPRQLGRDHILTTEEIGS